MDWNWATLWWIATGVLVAAELATGTFYLLMLAIGTPAGAQGAHARLYPSTQMLWAAAAGGAAARGAGPAAPGLGPPIPTQNNNSITNL